jgi:hypothetical protein
MSTVIRRRRSSRASLGPYKRHELLGGRIEYPIRNYDGYGDGIGLDLRAFIGPEMRADWAANREVLLEFWRSGQSPTFFPDCLPWLCTYIAPGSLPWACRYLD